MYLQTRPTTTGTGLDALNFLQNEHALEAFYHYRLWLDPLSQYNSHDDAIK